MTKTCLLSGDPITSENDSRAHVIPSALGGRLKPKGLLSDDANGVLNDAVDLPLIRAFEPIMAQLDGSRDRGTDPSIRMTDAAGRTYDVEFGKTLKLSTPEFSMDEQPDGSVVVQVSTRTPKELRTLLGRVHARFPNFDIEAAMLQAAVTNTRASGKLHSRVQIGPAVTFPAAFVGASIFAAHRGFAAHPNLARYVASLDPRPEPVPLPPDTFLWHQPTWFEVDAEVSHVLILIGEPGAGRMLAFTEYFNIASVAVVLPYAGSERVRETYAVNILTGEEPNVTVDEAALAALPWVASHHLGDAALYTDMTTRISRIIGIAQERARSTAIDKVIEETVGPIDGRKLTLLEQQALHDRLAQFLRDITRED